MVDVMKRRRSPVVSPLVVLVVFNTVTFLLGAVLHIPVEVPLGFTTLREPQIIPATIVEGLAGLLFAFAGPAMATRQTWQRGALIVAHVFSLVGVFVGITALALGGGEATTLNTAYHWLMVVLLTAGLVLLFTPSGRALARRDTRAGGVRVRID